MLDQRRRRWADVVYMLYKCFVFTGMSDAAKPPKIRYFFNKPSTHGTLDQGRLNVGPASQSVGQH